MQTHKKKINPDVLSDIRSSLIELEGTVGRGMHSSEDVWIDVNTGCYYYSVSVC